MQRFLNGIQFSYSFHKFSIYRYLTDPSSKQPQLPEVAHTCHLDLESRAGTLLLSSHKPQQEMSLKLMYLHVQEYVHCVSTQLR